MHQDVCRLNLHQDDVALLDHRPIGEISLSLLELPSMKGGPFKTQRQNRMTIAPPRGIAVRGKAMAHDMNDTSPKRAAPISYRPPAKLADEFEARLRASGLSTNAFLNEAVFRKRGFGGGVRRLLATLLAACAEIKDLLRSIETSEGEPEVLERVEEELKLIRTALMQLLGRRS